MTCVPTETRGELEFVHALLSRDTELEECRGPLLRLSFRTYDLTGMERTFDSETASELLWSGYRPLDPNFGFQFELCAAHWVDLAALCSIRSAQLASNTALTESRRLIANICQAAGWDAKEIANMFAWQRERLT